jgi:hypothetical protein
MLDGFSSPKSCHVSEKRAACEAAHEFPKRENTITARFSNEIKNDWQF